jgi:hypothetical protein
LTIEQQGRLWDRIKFTTTIQALLLRCDYVETLLRISERVGYSGENNCSLKTELSGLKIQSMVFCRTQPNR